jgi:aspartate carbamoyltransferase catalytic subunit
MPSFQSVDQLSRQEIERLIKVATAMKQQKLESSCMKHKLMICAFYEASTRTRLSFSTAMLKLGGRVLTFDDKTSSAATKNETFRDTMRTLDQLADVIVLRHFDENSPKKAAGCLQRAVLINAGNGTDEHPTQTMQDLFTIHEELGRIDGLSVTFCGDLRFSRTVHSLAKALSKFHQVHLRFVPLIDGLDLPAELWHGLAATKGVTLSHHKFLEDVISCTDILYVTRYQQERAFLNRRAEVANSLNRVTMENLRRAPAHLRILHPLPRREEMDPKLHDDPRAAYFTQLGNGLWMRMAILVDLFQVAVPELTKPSVPEQSQLRSRM